jgi:hypothetical protein
MILLLMSFSKSCITFIYLYNYQWEMLYIGLMYSVDPEVVLVHQSTVDRVSIDGDVAQRSSMCGHCEPQ